MTLQYVRTQAYDLHYIMHSKNLIITGVIPHFDYFNPDNENNNIN